MGLYINLTVNPLRLSPAKWEEVFHESCCLLKRFPIPLMRVKREEYDGHERYMYTANIISEQGSKGENWCISGDLVSGQSAESFTLYRHLDKQFAYYGENPHIKPPWQDKDPLWAKEEDIDYAKGNGTDIFYRKTQGHPYHLALLAVGILFESRFPKQCYVWGDYDRYQVEKMVKWTNTVLEDPVTMPVCLDGEQLYKRLEALYDEPRLAIERFQLLYRASEEEALQILLSLADRQALYQWLLQELKGYESLSQLGIINQLAQFLSVTQDIKQLISLVLATDEREKFPLEDLLRLLCQHFITIEIDEREPLLLFAYRSDLLMTSKDFFSRLFITMGGGMPWAVQFYMDKATLLSIFSSYEPTKRVLFEQIIQEGEQKCCETLREIEALILKRQEEQDVSEQKKLTQYVVVFPSDESEPSAEPQPEITYILNQVESQRQTFPEPIAAAQLVSKQLQQVIEQHPDMFASDERAYYLEKISFASSYNNIILRESAWQRIDAETNIAYLASLFALTVISDHSMSFTRWRRYFLEHPELWFYFAASKSHI